MTVAVLNDALQRQFLPSRQLLCRHDHLSSHRQCVSAAWNVNGAWSQRVSAAQSVSAAWNQRVSAVWSVSAA